MNLSEERLRDASHTTAQMAVVANHSSLLKAGTRVYRHSLRSFDVPVSGRVTMVSMGRLESPPFAGDSSSEHEDVNTCDSSLTPSSIQAVDTSESTSTLRPNSDDAQGYLHYTSKVEFGLKLGYTESQVQTALVKLGPQADQNELLAELIKLGAITSTSSTITSSNNINANNNNNISIKNNNNNAVTSRVANGPCSSLSSSSFDPVTRCSCISPHRADCTMTTACTGSKVGSSGASSCSPCITVPPSLSSQFCESCYVNALRPIVIDGTNVAISHGKRDIFSCRGIRICVDWFRSRGHKEISVLVPMWRKEYSRPDAPIIDQHILLELEKENILVFTPSRSVNGQRINCHDDRFIIKLAAENGGVVVSNDKFQDLLIDYSTKNPNIEYQKVIRDRLLMYVFVNDLIMIPDDPLGREGISLDRFLLRPGEKGPCPHMLTCHSSNAASMLAAVSSQPPACPYNKKCTYGNKCKYYHPERGNQPVRSVTDRMAEQARIQLLDMKTRSMDAEVERMKACHTASLPPTLPTTGGDVGKRKTLIRTKSVIPSAHTCGQLQSLVNTPHKYNLFHSGALAAVSPHPKKNLPSNCKFSSNSCAELFAFDPHLNPQTSSCSSDSAEHLNLGKRFSDPVKAASQDSVITCNSYSLSEQGSPDSAIHQRQGSSIHLQLSSSPHPAVASSHFAQSALHHHQQLQSSHSLNASSNAPGNRQHRKLARQLTLNPYEQSNVFQCSSERGHSSPSTSSTHATGLVRRTPALLPEVGDSYNAAAAAAACTGSGHSVQAPIGSQRPHWSSIQAPIGCHRQQSLRRMRSEADSSPSVSSCSSFSMVSSASTCSNNAPHSSGTLDCFALLTQAREALQAFAKDGTFNRVFSDVVLLSMGEDGSLDAELTVESKHCNGHGSLHEAFISGLMYTVSSLSFHIPLGVDFNSCASSSIVPSNTGGMNCCSCGTTVELSIAYLSLAKKGDVISLHCDVLKLENRLTFQQIEIFNKSNENKHIATGIHVISPN